MLPKHLCVLGAAACLLLCCSCASTSDARLTNPNQPGPALGSAVGTAAGAVAGNVAAIPVAAAEGAAKAAKAPFDHEKRVIRTWKTEVTPDGRTIQVPVDVEVDQYGRPIAQ
ncbi:hypothetical protein GALL_40340 [mine drainage metagenome]|uniref:Uncharacterized protein n=1 Tax=mine drainage metagenome TaxID=410659 RepID=A0A1J5TSD1_9ZZZZ